MGLSRLLAAVAGAGLTALAAAPVAQADAAAPTGSARPAHRSAVPYLHLTTSMSGPMFGDDADVMYYSFDVTNDPASQTSATGIVLRMTVLACARKDEPDALCTPEPTYLQSIEALAPGQSYNGAVPVNLPNNQPELWLRFTPEIEHVDQLVRGAAPGTCGYGAHPSDLCAPTVFDLKP